MRDTWRDVEPGAWCLLNGVAVDPMTHEQEEKKNMHVSSATEIWGDF